jgi:A/G-specific adenine glycosylase
MTKPNKPIPPTPRLSPRQIRVLAGRLLTWYDSDKRDLPWRRTCDPYAILVSEFMLQQTQVATVIPYFERFMAAFPTVRALAAAPEQQVLRLWAGLGYYGRARHLHAAARRIVEAYGGRIPPRVGDLLFLPGVGSYVAGAVASIAFGVPVPAVDANVARVLSRLFALTGDPASPRVRKDLESLAAALIPPERPGDFNQAMMELGARVCAATRPLCDPCPVRSSCKAAQQGNPLDYPAPARRPETVEVEEALAVVRVEDRASAPAVVRAGDRVDARAGAPAVVRSGDRVDTRYLIVQRPGDSGRYRNMWEFPHVAMGEGRRHSRTTDRISETLTAFLFESFGLKVRVDDEWAEIRHQVTHHKIRKRVFLCTLADEKARPADADSLRWVTLAEISEYPLGAPHKRILALLRESARLFSL